MRLDWAELTDGELVTLALAQRPEAFAALVRRFQSSVFRVIRHYLGDADEALDVAQETFLAAHRALADYDGVRPLRTWLLVIALNKCRDWERRRAVRQIFSFARPLDAEAERVADPDAGIEDTLIGREELARTLRAITRLPAPLKEVLILRTLDGLSQSETADLLGVSEKAVETRLYRARGRLVEMLEPGRK